MSITATQTASNDARETFQMLPCPSVSAVPHATHWLSPSTSPGVPTSSANAVSSPLLSSR